MAAIPSLSIHSQSSGFMPDTDICLRTDTETYNTVTYYSLIGAVATPVVAAVVSVALRSICPTASLQKDPAGTTEMKPGEKLGRLIRGVLWLTSVTATFGLGLGQITAQIQLKVKDLFCTTGKNSDNSINTTLSKESHFFGPDKAHSCELKAGEKNAMISKYSLVTGVLTPVLTAIALYSLDKGSQNTVRTKGLSRNKILPAILLPSTLALLGAGLGHAIAQVQIGVSNFLCSMNQVEENS